MIVNRSFPFLSFFLATYTIQSQRREREDMELARKLHEQEAKRTQSKQSPHHQADQVSNTMQSETLRVFEVFSKISHTLMKRAIRERVQSSRYSNMTDVQYIV